MKKIPVLILVNETRMNIKERVKPLSIARWAELMAFLYDHIEKDYAFDESNEMEMEK